MISAQDKKWSSPTTLFLARRIEVIAQGRSLQVMDLGCGDGRTLEQLGNYGHELFGYDLSTREETLRNRLERMYKGNFESHFKITDNEREIPFEDRRFDIVYANQVFEHVKFLEQIFAESSRVLKSGGRLITLFPLATSIIEPHLKIPWVHHLPPGNFRQNYIRAFYFFRKRSPERSLKQVAVEQDKYLRHEVYYRFINEILTLGDVYFASCEYQTSEFVTAKLDLMVARQGISRQLGKALQLMPRPFLSSLVSHQFGVALEFIK